MRYRSWRLPASIVAILLIAATAGAPPLLPPSLSIRQSENAVAVVTVLERVEADRLRVRRDVVLQEDFVVVDGGLEPPTEIVVTVGEEVAAGATVGEAYILGYTSLNPVPKQKHTFSVDPEGPQIFRIPSVGPALLPDSPPLRKLVTPRATEEELSPRE